MAAIYITGTTIAFLNLAGIIFAIFMLTSIPDNLMKKKKQTF
ncbi:hypothetical protein [Desulfamplus magnetovallimortis]|nr:hypothetical protein [Desulfamplus magnetovallimortis]